MMLPQRDTKNFPEPVWFWWDEPYLYMRPTLLGLLLAIVTGWRNDRHLVG